MNYKQNKFKIMIGVLAIIALFLCLFIDFHKEDLQSEDQCYKDLKIVKEADFYNTDDPVQVKIKCKTILFADELALRLQQKKIIFKVNSGVRSTERNDEAGGVNNSAHIFGWAFDAAAPDGVHRYWIVFYAIEIAYEWGPEYSDFLRVGVGDKYIHIDFDDKKPSNVLWADLDLGTIEWSWALGENPVGIAEAKAVSQTGRIKMYQEIKLLQVPTYQ